MIPPFEIFGKTFSIYTIIILIGLFAAGLFACAQIKRRKLDVDDMIVVLLICCGGAVLGGHILYGLTHPSLIPQTFALLFQTGFSGEFWQSLLLTFGGSVFYGGLLGGMAAGGVCWKRKRLPTDFVDVMAVSVPLFHTFGRIGCFLGGCCYGIECSVGFVYTQNPIEIANGVRRFPVQLLEALFCFLLFLALFALLRRGLCRGKLLALYLSVYAVGRFLLEYLRGDTYRGFVLGLSTSQFISVLILAGTAVYLCADRVRASRRAAP